MPVDILLVHPIDNDNDYHKQEQQIGNLKNVESIKRPYIEDDHDLKLDGEGRPAYLLMQSHLAILTPLIPRAHNLLPSIIE